MLQYCAVMIMRLAFCLCRGARWTLPSFLILAGQKGHTWYNQRRLRLVGLLVGGRSRVVSNVIKL